MSWFFIALLAPALWSASNHFDKYFVSRYFNVIGTGALVLFSSLIGLVMIPPILLFKSSVLDVTALQAGTVMVSGMAVIISVVLYLYAMERDDASTVAPLYQTIPVFAFILGYLVLGETLTATQIIGSLCIIAGGVGLSLDLTAKKVRLKKIILILMLAASLLFAVSGLLFKLVAVETDFWTGAFWGYVGDVTIGLFFLACIPSYRRAFFRVLRDHTRRIIGLNICNELITVIANLAMRFASLLAPLALVWAVNGLQPFFVFVYGLILTKWFPSVSTENINRRNIAQKIVMITIMFIGTVIITL